MNYIKKKIIWLLSCLPESWLHVALLAKPDIAMVQLVTRKELEDMVRVMSFHEQRPEVTHDLH